MRLVVRSKSVVFVIRCNFLLVDAVWAVLAALYALYTILKHNGPNRCNPLMPITLSWIASILSIVGSVVLGLNLPIGCVFGTHDCLPTSASGVIGFLVGITYGVLFLVVTYHLESDWQVLDTSIALRSVACAVRMSRKTVNPETWKVAHHRGGPRAI